eukprot:6201617-Pleurochrysis_carterae.AAC.2
MSASNLGSLASKSGAAPGAACDADKIRGRSFLQDCACRIFTACRSPLRTEPFQRCVAWPCEPCALESLRWRDAALRTLAGELAHACERTLAAEIWLLAIRHTRLPGSGDLAAASVWLRGGARPRRYGTMKVPAVGDGERVRGESRRGAP